MKFNLMVAFLFSITATAVFGQEIKYVDLATAERGEYTSYLWSDGAGISHFLWGKVSSFSVLFLIVFNKFILRFNWFFCSMSLLYGKYNFTWGV